MKFRLVEDYEDTKEFEENELLDEEVDDIDEYFYNHHDGDEEDIDEDFKVGDKVMVNHSGRKGYVEKKRRTLYDVDLLADRHHRRESDVFFERELSLTEGAEDTDIVVTDEDELEGPQTDKETGISNLIISLINDEWRTINEYNDFIVNAKAQGVTDCIPVINDIVEEEHKHIGQLQAILKTISNVTDAIDLGMVEGEQQLGDVETTVVVDDADDDVSGLDIIADATANYFKG